MYRLQALVFNFTHSLGVHTGERARENVLDLILRFHPRRVWLYVKHFRWMFSDEYAMLQETYIGTGPIFAAKTEALLRPGPEDEVVKGELMHDKWVELNW